MAREKERPRVKPFTPGQWDHPCPGCGRRIQWALTLCNGCAPPARCDATGRVLRDESSVPRRENLPWWATVDGRKVV